MTKDEFIRLNKLVASYGLCSRRKAEDLIISGAVKVNGELVTDLSSRFPATSAISINGLDLKPPAKKIYLAMNKPIQVICSMSDPQKRTTVFDLTPDKYKKFRPVPAGRLDYFSEGLLILSNDGIFNQKLIHPGFSKIKKYEVIVRENVEEIALEDMRKGMVLADNTKYRPVKVTAIRQKNCTKLDMELTQGLNRQIRRMCEKWNLTILKLKRVSIGKIKLGNLKSGCFRELSQEEILSI